MNDLGEEDENGGKKEKWSSIALSINSSIPIEHPWTLKGLLYISTFLQKPFSDTSRSIWLCKSNFAALNAS